MDDKRENQPLRDRLLAGAAAPLTSPVSKQYFAALRLRCVDASNRAADRAVQSETQERHD